MAKRFVLTSPRYTLSTDNCRERALQCVRSSLNLFCCISRERQASIMIFEAHADACNFEVDVIFYEEGKSCISYWNTIRLLRPHSPSDPVMFSRLCDLSE